MKKSFLFLLLLLPPITGCLNDSGGKSPKTGEANVLVRLERVGALSKTASTATIQMASLYITLATPGQDTVRDTLPLSGSAQQTISKTYGSLASQKIWTLTAVAKDAKGTVIHSGSTTFSVPPHGSTDVALSLSAQYSMLKALFFPVRDSVTRFELRVDGNLVADSAFAKQALLGDTVRLTHDYLSSSAGGVGHSIRLDAYGVMWGDSVLLYRGDTAITVVSGRDTAYRIILRWVGPNTPPPGQAQMSVTLGATGNLVLLGELEDPIANYVWQNLGVSGFTQGAAYNSSMAVGPDGTPFIAFTDGANGFRATVLRWNGSTWETVGNAGFTLGNISNSSLKIDANGYPVLAFTDVQNSVKAAVIRWNGSTWQTVGTGGISQGDGYSVSLALDATGNPTVAFSDYGNGGKAGVMHWNGTSWQAFGNMDISTGPVYKTSLALDASGNPVVAYADGASGGKATVMRWNGATWQSVGNSRFSQGNINDPSLALEASGNPVVAYADEVNGTKATVMRWNGTTWQGVGTALSQGGSARLTLALNAGGNPVVSYLDSANGNKATVKRWNGSAWQTLGTAGFSPNAVTDPSMALNAAGYPIVSFQDPANGNKATVMRFVPGP